MVVHQANRRKKKVVCKIPKLCLRNGLLLYKICIYESEPNVLSEQLVFF